MLREVLYGPQETQSALPQESQSAVALEPLGTFGRAIRVDLSGHPGWRSLDWAISLGIHAFVLGVLAVAPFFFYQEMRPFAFTKTLLMLPDPVMATPAAKMMAAHQRSCALCDDIMFSTANSKMPVFARRRGFDGPGNPPLPVTTAGVASGAGNPIGNLLGQLPEMAPPEIPRDAQVIRVGGDLTSSRLLYGLSLPYPPLAKTLLVTGHVVVEALIDESGKVTKIEHVRGPALLAMEAVRAVSEERFQPAMLDGQPTKCQLLVDVTFNLTR